MPVGGPPERTADSAIAVETKGLRTRKRIEAALRELLAEKSFRHVTITDICRAAGVSAGGFYFHFANQEDLLAKVMRQHLASLENAMTAALSTEKLEPALLALCEAFLESYANATALSRTLQQLVGTNREYRSQWRGLQHEIVRRCASLIFSAGRARNPDHAVFLAYAIVTAITNILTGLYIFPADTAYLAAPSRASMLRSLESTCLRMLGTEVPVAAQNRPPAQGKTASAAPAALATAPARSFVPQAHPAHGSRRQERSQQTRSRIMGALSELLEQREYAAISIVDICRRAGIAVGGFYFHFKRKEDLTWEAMHGMAEVFWDRMDTALQYRDVYSAIFHASTTYLRSFKDTPGHVRCFNQLATGDRVYVELWERSAANWVRRLLTLVKACDSRSSDRTTFFTSYGLMGFVDALLYSLYIDIDAMLRDHAGSAEQVAEQLAVLWYRALLGRSPPAARLAFG